MSEIRIHAVPRTAHRRPPALLALALAAAALVAVGGYAATQAIGPDDTPSPAAIDARPAPGVAPDDAFLLRFRDSIAAQYGTAQAGRTSTAAAQQRVRENRNSIAAQYGTAPAQAGRPSTAAEQQRLRENRDSIARLYRAPR